MTHKDTIVWQQSFDLAKSVRSLSRDMRTSNSKRFGLPSDLERVSIALMSDIAEAFKNGKNTKFMRNALIDVDELAVLLDLAPSAPDLKKQAAIIGDMLTALINAKK